MRFGAEHCIGNRWIKLARIVACLKVAQWIRKAEGLKYVLLWSTAGYYRGIGTEQVSWKTDLYS